jgi:chemotaxis protein methyltransferase CheR
MSQDLRALAGAVQRIGGLAATEARLDSLQAALRRVDPDLTAGELLRDPDPTRRRARLDRVVDQTTVNETYLIRHSDELAAIDWKAMAARAASERRKVRVWSAGCSSGEEPCSLALFAAEALGSVSPPIEILGTDISDTALAAAERGEYGARSARLVDANRRARWFRATKGGLRVRHELRALIRFARHNLVQDPAPPIGEQPFDLIVCRNVLIYFDERTAAGVIANLRGGLTKHGMLLLGTADRLGLRPGDDAAPRSPVSRLPPPPQRRRATSRVAAPAPATRPDSPPREAANAAFESGLRALSDGDPAAAIASLRRAEYLDPAFAVATFQLGRAYELVGDVGSSRRAYSRTLRLTEAADDPAVRLYDRVGAGDVATACRSRLAALARVTAAGR